MFKILYAPAPFETAVSLLAALATTTLDPKIQQLRVAALRSSAPLLQTLPCSLRLFCALTDDFYGDVLKLLGERTLFPFYLGCMRPCAAAKLTMQACDGNPGRLCCPAPPIHLQAANRYGMDCSECSRINLELTGRRCSLTLHCLPYLTRCPIHRCPLQVVASCSRNELLFLAQSNRARRSNSVILGSASAELLESARSYGALEAIGRALRDRGYVAEDGKLRLSALTKDVTATFSAGFEDMRLNTWLSSGNLLPQVLRHLEHPRNLLHPTGAALLGAALSRIEYVAPITVTATTRRNSRVTSPEKRVQRTMEMRSLWLAHQANQAGRTRKAVRTSASALWMWLYRNDRQWLDNNQPRLRSDRKQNSIMPRSRA